MSNIVPVTSAGKDLITFDQKKLDIIRKSVGKDLNEIEFDFFMSVARARGLDPILNQIHAVKRNDSSSGQKTMTIQVGIDGFRLIAARTGEYAGCDKTVFEYNEDGNLISADVTVYRLVQGQRCGFTASADWKEFFPGDKLGFMWKAKPRTMLGKCAEAQALRKAFPNDLAGIYEPSEIPERDATIEDIGPDNETEHDEDKNDFDDQKRQSIESLFEKFRKIGVSSKDLMLKLKRPENFDKFKIKDDEIESLRAYGSELTLKKAVPSAVPNYAKRSY